MTSKSPNLHAIDDVVTALTAARKASQVITTVEIHAFCYFGRMLAASFENTAGLPYCYTFGRHGGPYSEDIELAIGLLAEAAVLVQYHRDGDEIKTCELANATGQALLSSSDDLASQTIASVVHATALRGIPYVVNAIYFDPNLREARASGAPEGVPLPHTEFAAWCKHLMATSSEIAKAPPWIGAFAVVDALAKQAETASNK